MFSKASYCFVFQTLKMKAKIAQTLCDPWNSLGQNTGVKPFPSPGHLPNPGSKPRSPTLKVDSFKH